MASGSSPSGSGFLCTFVRGLVELESHRAAIDDLAPRSIEENPFYHPWMLFPALEGLGESSRARFLLIFKEDSAGHAANLCGFFPILEGKRHHGIPVSSVALLTHMYCFHAVPLVDRDTGKAVLECFFDYCRLHRMRIVEFPSVATDSAFHGLLVDVIHEQSLSTRIEGRFLRGFFRVPGSPAEYLAQAFSGRTRKHFRRQRERLAALGQLEYSALEKSPHPQQWISDFLALEASGWKGREGTALASLDAHRTFFVAASSEAVRRRQMVGSALRLEGRMIAGRVAFVAGSGSFLFKIAYDETLEALSPGYLLEVETIEAGLPDPVRWTDCCTAPNNTMYRRLWSDTRTIENIVLSLGSFRGDVALTAIPLLRVIKRRLARRSGPSRQTHAQTAPERPT